MKTIDLKEFYKVMGIDERDVKIFRQLASNTVQIIFKDGHEAIFKLEPRRILKDR